jgi:DNA-binding transcriptional MerR regulator
MTAWLTVSEAAKASGLPAETIRYYERTGVLPGVPRSPNGYRCYTAAHVETLRFARSLRELGLSPAAIAALVKLFHDGTCAEMKGALAGTIGQAIARVESQREDLERTAMRLRMMLGAVQSVVVGDHPSAGVGVCDCVAAIERDLADGQLFSGGTAR